MVGGSASKKAKRTRNIRVHKKQTRKNTFPMRFHPAPGPVFLGVLESAGREFLLEYVLFFRALCHRPPKPLPVKKPPHTPIGDPPTSRSFPTSRAGARCVGAGRSNVLSSNLRRLALLFWASSRPHLPHPPSITISAHQEAHAWRLAVQNPRCRRPRQRCPPTCFPAPAKIYWPHVYMIVSSFCLQLRVLLCNHHPRRRRRRSLADQTNCRSHTCTTQASGLGLQSSPS